MRTAPRKNLIIGLTLCLGMHWLSRIMTSGADSFVAPDGSELNPGSRERPFATIQHGITTLRAGDTLHLRRGRCREQVPLYAHPGIGDGLSLQHCEFLADHFSLITFTDGIVRDAVSVEPKIAAASKTIKQRNPDTKVLFN